MCTSPIKAVCVGKTPTGKNKYRWLGRMDKQKSFFDNGAYNFTTNDINSEFIEIPCGVCEECRLAYAKQWSDRCMLELPYHKENWFLTLTYDDEHLPRSGVGEFSTLVKKDLQDFIKRLRYHLLEDYPDYEKEYGKIMYYACGEYGSASLRSHFHIIMYSLHLPDLEVIGKTKLGDTLYKSDYVEKIWDKGLVSIGKVTYASASYVARYVMKKAHGKDKELLESRKMNPEFTTMSRRPAIGKQYYEQHKDSVYKYDYISVSTEEGGKNIYPPKYFDRLLEKENPTKLQEIKDDRLAKSSTKEFIPLEGTSLTLEEYRDVKASIMKNRANKLKRSY